MKVSLIAITLSLAVFCNAYIGVDMSADDCHNMTPQDWECLYNNDFVFAILQAWHGGMGYNDYIGEASADANQAGFVTDVYIFMCPLCENNEDPETVIETVLENLREDAVNYTNIWLDVEQCDGCWNDDLDLNCEYIMYAASNASHLGVSVGIYSSKGEWPMTVGDNCDDLSNYFPLWYAHYDNEANFDDGAYEFGGWTEPSLKQYTNSGPCVDIDQDYLPANSQVAKLIMRK